MKKLRCLIFIEVDVVIRHFINNKSFHDLCSKHEVKFIFPEKGNKRFQNINLNTLGISSDYERLIHNKKRYNLWKQVFHVDQLRFRLGTQARAMRNFRRKTLKWKASLLYSFLGLPFIWSIFKFFRNRELLKKTDLDMENLIKNFQPEVVIHPCVLEGLFINDLIQICRNFKIPSIIIMNSWDNPSTKRAMIGNPDWLLVWGEQTQKHAIEYCNMSKNKVIKFGAAQFEVYNGTPKNSKVEFKQIYGFSNRDFIILYAGSSKGTDEIKQLNLLDKAIEKGVLKNTIVIYRPHPWGQGGKNGLNIIDIKWKNILFDKSMVSYLNQLKKGIKSKFLSDYNDTHNILSHVDAIISPLSTILIEGAIHGKPSLCFVPTEDRSMHFEIDSELIHFQEFFESKNFLKAYGYDNFIPEVFRLKELAKKKNISKILKKEASYYVEKFNTPYPIRLTRFIETICKSRKYD